jgi:hypothetical protein
MSGIDEGQAGKGPTVLGPGQGLLLGSGQRDGLQGDGGTRTMAISRSQIGGLTDEHLEADRDLRTVLITSFSRTACVRTPAPLYMQGGV